MLLLGLVLVLIGVSRGTDADTRPPPPRHTPAVAVAAVIVVIVVGGGNGGLIGVNDDGDDDDDDDGRIEDARNAGVTVFGRGKPCDPPGGRAGVGATGVFRGSSW